MALNGINHVIKALKHRLSATREEHEALMLRSEEIAGLRNRSWRLLKSINHSNTSIPVVITSIAHSLKGTLWKIGLQMHNRSRNVLRHPSVAIMHPGTFLSSKSSCAATEIVQGGVADVIVEATIFDSADTGIELGRAFEANLLFSWAESEGEGEISTIREKSTVLGTLSLSPQELVIGRKSASASASSSGESESEWKVKETVNAELLLCKKDRDVDMESSSKLPLSQFVRSFMEKSLGMEPKRNVRMRMGKKLKKRRKIDAVTLSEAASSDWDMPMNESDMWDLFTVENELVVRVEMKQGVESDHEVVLCVHAHDNRSLGLFLNLLHSSLPNHLCIQPYGASLNVVSALTAAVRCMEAEMNLNLNMDMDMDKDGEDVPGGSSDLSRSELELEVMTSTDQAVYSLYRPHP